MKRSLFILMLVPLLLAGCKGKATKTLLPNVSGKAGEVIVVMEKSQWEGALGSEVRGLLAADCPWLPMSEPLYNLVNVTPGNFMNMFKVHRNVLKFEINPQSPKTAVESFSNVWAKPQCVIQISAPDSEMAITLVRDNAPLLLATLEQAERDRIIANSKRYEVRALGEQVRELFGGSPHFPSGYKLKKKTPGFVWIADEKQYTNQGIFIYRYPASGAADELSVGKIIAHRNEILKANVPGMFEGTYMTTGTFFPPTVEYIHYRGRDFAQTRGLWEVENDYMGGPFVSHSFYSLDGSEIFVVEGFVYAARFDKRHYLRQVESIIYSWDWDTEEKEEK